MSTPSRKQLSRRVGRQRRQLNHLTKAHNRGIATLKALHDSEINFEISVFFDGDWQVRLGDHMNGFKSEASVPSCDEALQWLHDEAIKLFPDSQFANLMRGKP